MGTVEVPHLAFWTAAADTASMEFSAYIIDR